jgi:hypothetical protein
VVVIATAISTPLRVVIMLALFIVATVVFVVMLLAVT